MKKLFIILTCGLLFGCATEQISNRCQRYVTSGENVDWKPIKFYQSESSQNILYIEIPKTANYIPKLEVIDTEFDQPYKIDYTFDNTTHRFKVEDNHDQYLLYRETYDGIQKDSVYVACDREIIN
jgi:poly(3-hydroxyalkanoate) synthetase